MTKRPYSSSTELQIWTPEKKCEPSSSRRRDIYVAPSSGDSTSFALPTDWFVDEKRRFSGAYRGATDKHYHVPGTGRKFRSLTSVKRHLTETDCHEIRTNVSPLSISFTGVDHGSRPYIKPAGSFMKTFKCKSDSQIVVYRKPYTPKHQVSIDQSKPFELPDGWFIKKSIRRSGHSMGKVDKYYCERDTGRVFRSLVDVQRYLADIYTEENTTLSKLFKPAGLIQTSGSEKTDDDNTGDIAIMPHSSYDDSYSDHSDDMLLKDLVRKCDDGPPKDIVRNADDVPLKNFVTKSADGPHKNFVRISKDKDLVRNAEDVSLKGSAQKANDVPTKDLAPKSDNALLKDFVRQSPNARKTRKQTYKPASPSENVFSCTANILPGIGPDHPVRIKWVLNGPAGDDWSPFSGDTMVPESLNQEWARTFMYIVSQKYPDGSSSDA